MAANTQPRSMFFKPPPKIRISVYESILVGFCGTHNELIGPLSSCRRTSIELETEMARVIYQNLSLAIQAMQSEWDIQQCPPVMVTLHPYSKDLKHHDITLNLALPNSALTSSWHAIKCLHRSIFPPLSRFDLASLNISFFNDDAYNPDMMWLTYPGPWSALSFAYATYHWCK